MKVIQGKLQHKRIAAGKEGVGPQLALKASEAEASVKHKKKKKKKKHAALDSSDGSASSDDCQVFQEGALRGDTGILDLAKDHSGQLFQRGLEEMNRYLRDRGAPDQDVRAVEPRLVAY